VVMLFMAWSPVRRFNAGWFEVDHPETTPPSIPTNPATAPGRCPPRLNPECPAASLF